MWREVQIFHQLFFNLCNAEEVEERRREGKREICEEKRKWRKGRKCDVHDKDKWLSHSNSTTVKVCIMQQPWLVFYNTLLLLIILFSYYYDYYLVFFYYVDFYDRKLLLKLESVKHLSYLLGWVVNMDSLIELSFILLIYHQFTIKVTSSCFILQTGAACVTKQPRFHVEQADGLCVLAPCFSAVLLATCVSASGNCYCK